MDLREFKERTTPLVVREEFGEGALRFTVELRLCDKRELELMFNRCSKRVWDRKTRTRDTEVDAEKLRRELAPLILGWEGLTWAKLCRLTGVRFAENGASKVDLTAEVPVTDDFKLHLLEAAFGFEVWLIERLTEVSEQAAEQLELEKKTFGSTPADT